MMQDAVLCTQTHAARQNTLPSSNRKLIKQRNLQYVPDCNRSSHDETSSLGVSQVIISKWYGSISLHHSLYVCEERILRTVRGLKRSADNMLTGDVTVSMSAFRTSHQCYCAGSSLTWGLNLRALVCGIFWSSSPGVFSRYSGFLPSFIS